MILRFALHVSLVVDRSGSMGAARSNIRASGVTFDSRTRKNMQYSSYLTSNNRRRSK